MSAPLIPSTDKIQQLMTQLEQWFRPHHPPENIPKRIFLTTPGQIIVLNLSEIAYLRSSSNYTFIKMADGSRHTSSKHLKTYGETLDPNPDFLRIHRSSIVNKNFVKAIFRKGHNTILLMKDDEKLSVSAQKKEWILSELSK